jgi:hypothetical protein
MSLGGFWWKALVKIYYGIISVEAKVESAKLRPADGAIVLTCDVGGKSGAARVELSLAEIEKFVAASRAKVVTP